MTRQLAKIPKLRLHPPTGQFFYERRGKRTYLGKDKAVAEYRLAQIIPKLLESPEPVKPIETNTLAGLLLIFVRERLPKYEPSTRERFTRAITDLNEMFGNLPPSMFRPKDYVSLGEHWLASPSRQFHHGQKKTLSRQYTNQLLSCVRQVFRWLLLNTDINSEAANRIIGCKPIRRGVGREVEERHPLTEAEFATLLQEADDVTRRMLTVQRCTGMRPGELCAMRWEEISDAGNGLKLYLPTSHKKAWRGMEEAIYLGPRAQEALPTAKESGLVWESSINITPHVYYARCRRAAKRAGVRFFPYLLRHAKAKELLEKFGGAAVVAGLRHSSGSLVKRYAGRATGVAQQLAKDAG